MKKVLEQVLHTQNKKGLNMQIKEKNLLQQFFDDELVQNLQSSISALRQDEKKSFNIFKVLKLDNHEIRHSNFLAWLLNPKEHHGCGDKFLKQFLAKAIGEQNNISDTSDVVIETEYLTNAGRRIDILIHSLNSDFVCVIENKYGSDEHDEQCKHYKDFIEKYSQFRNYQHQHYIFLDIEMPPQELLDNALSCYQPITYKDIYMILIGIKSSFEQNSYIYEIIKQYSQIIKEKYIMLDTETKKQCREIYGKYKEVLETLKEYNTEFQNDIYNIMKEVVTDKSMNLKNADIDAFGYNNTTGCGVRFIPNEISSVEKINTKTKFTNYSLFFTLDYKTDLTLAIYSIELNGKWVEHDSAIIEVLNKSDEEIKTSIKSEIERLKSKIVTIAQSK